MNKAEFISSDKNGVFLFYSDLCKQCELVKDTLQTKVPSTKTVLCDEDPEYYWKTHNVDMIPCVRFYRDGVMTFEKIYKLEDSDYAKLLELST